MGIVFDGSVTLGNILTIISIVGAGFVFVMTMRADLSALGLRVEKVEGIMSKVIDALIQLAKQEERLDSHAQRLRRLEDGGPGAKSR